MVRVPQDPLLRVQEVLNGTEVNLQHLTALVDCRSLHLVRGGEGLGQDHGDLWGGNKGAAAQEDGDPQQTVGPQSRLWGVVQATMAGLRASHCPLHPPCLWILLSRPVASGLRAGADRLLL